MISIIEKKNNIFQTLPGDVLVEDFSRSTDPRMQKAWKERLEPNMKIYEDMKVGYGNMSSMILMCLR